jgi:MerR family transcriptional regulator/heat shock protein HspR
MSDPTIGDFAFPADGSGVNDDTAVYVISVAATLAGMHPQTLRQYDRLGIVSPGRTPGRGRRYSARNIALLRQVQRLSQDEGINLAGVKRILELEAHVDALRSRLAELLTELEATRAEIHRREAQVHQSYRRDLVPVEPSPMVIWRPQPPTNR